VSVGDVLARLAEPAVREDPFPLFRQVREQDPVHRTSAGFYLVTRHADAAAVLRGTGSDFLHPEPDTDPLSRQHPSHRLRLYSLLGRSGQSHDKLRRALAPHFTPRSTEALRPLVAQRCERLLDALVPQLRDGAVVDLNTALARPLAFGSIADLAGVAPADQD
jgi:cytochrome P450 family 114